MCFDDDAPHAGDQMRDGWAGLHVGVRLPGHRDGVPFRPTESSRGRRRSFHGMQRPRPGAVPLALCPSVCIYRHLCIPVNRRGCPGNDRDI